MNIFELAKKRSQEFPETGNKFTVYRGLKDGKIVYIGTTIQKPSDRFRWHRNNGKNFQFEIIQQFDNPEDILNLEFELIKEILPRYNNITHRKQNFNKKLTAEDIEKRKEDSSWCQRCLRRHVNVGYRYCKFCL